MPFTKNMDNTFWRSSYKVVLDGQERIFENYNRTALVEEVWNYIFSDTEALGRGVSKSELQVVFKKFKINGYYMGGPERNYRVNFVLVNHIDTMMNFIKMVDLVFPLVYPERTLALTHYNEFDHVCEIQ